MGNMISFCYYCKEKCNHLNDTNETKKKNMMTSIGPPIYEIVEDNKIIYKCENKYLV